MKVQFKGNAKLGSRWPIAHQLGKTLLGDQLRYLLYKESARQVISGTYDIPEEMDPATNLILEEIGPMGVKIVNGEGSKIEITPEDSKLF